MVDRRADHTILAPYRTFAAHWTGNFSPQSVWLASTGQYPATVCSPGRAASVLQHCSFHPHDYRYVLPPVSCKARRGKGPLYMRMAITPGIHILSMMNSGSPLARAARLGQLLCCLVSFLLLCSMSALAHDHHAPPARIITDEQVGPWTISLWAQQHM